MPPAYSPAASSDSQGSLVDNRLSLPWEYMYSVGYTVLVSYEEDVWRDSILGTLFMTGQ